MRNILYTIILSITLSLSLFGTVSAAGFDLVNLTTTPKSPGAMEKTILRIESFAVNLNTANIIWNVDGVFVKDGIADKELTVTTPDFGKKMVIDIIIMTAAGDKIDKQFIIAPAEVDLLWEAQTYTPPFYKGKALPTFKSSVRVSAIPRFNTLTSNPKEYYYKWTYNRTLVVGEALGKNSVVVPMGFTNAPVPVLVEVSLPGTDWKGTKNANITGTAAKIVLYENDPFYGVQFHHPITVAGTGARKTKETELTVYAVAYFFSSDDLANNRLVYTWEVNRRYTSPGLFPRYLTLVKPETGDATYAVSLRIQNPNRVLQEARASAQVSFTSL